MRRGRLGLASGAPDKRHCRAHMARPRAPFLDAQEFLGFTHGAMRWRSADRKRLYEWDEWHEHIETGYPLFYHEPMTRYCAARSAATDHA